MNRKQLVAALQPLQIPLTGKETEEELQTLLNKSLTEIGTKQQETLDTLEERMVTNPFECIGIFVDLTNPSCVLCVDKKDCVTKFINYFKEDFGVLEKIEADLEATQQAKETNLEVAKEAIKKERKSQKEKKKMGEKKKETVIVEGYNPEQKIGVYDVPLPVPEKDEEYPFYEAIMVSRIPSTVAELRVIVEEFCDCPEKEEDKIALVKDVLDVLLKNGIIGLVE